ncbi:MAG: type I glyceraldehyde-3-phosphate dehydrogenase [candidate division Zixibacteria bacterium]|nr:type I glyceraldehyde-3-phosphate dehydrogenase [candidate division Zixibacteria bacterium]
MATKVAINGFGRIGRLVVRKAITEGKLDFVSVNDITDAATLAHLFKYDSIHKKFNGEVRTEGDNLVINGKTIKVTKELDPAKLPHAANGVQVVVESTGKFTDRDGAAKHITAGAKKVLISAPAKGHDGTFVLGVNWDQYDKSKHHVISIGSCTTNCLAPVVKVLHDKFGIEKGLMTTIHAFTNDQKILDLPHKDLRRARAASMSMIPTTTGAAKAISEVIPEMKGKLDGLAVRVPTSDGSLVDLAAILNKEVTVDELNTAFKEYAHGKMKGILEYCEEPIVSIDIVGNNHSSILDSKLTQAKGSMIKVFSWYDNEWGFSCRMVEALEKMM